MKTKSLNTLLTHNFFLYGMVFLSILQLVNFYNSKSLICLGTFGVSYYIAKMYSKNNAVCLLIANIVSIFILSCEKSELFEGFKEGNEPGGPNATTCGGLDQGTCETTEGCLYGLENEDDSEPKCYEE